MDPFEYSCGPWMARETKDGEILITGEETFPGVTMEEGHQHEAQRLVDLLAANW